MGAGTVYLMFFLIPVAIVAAGVYLATRQRDGLNRDEKRELRTLRDLVGRIERVAIDHRDIAPELSLQITDEIRAAKNRELGN